MALSRVFDRISSWNFDKETDIFTLSWHEDLAPGDGTSNHAHNHCFDAEMDTRYDDVKSLAYWQCHGDYGNQLVKYLHKTQVIVQFVNQLLQMLFQQLYKPASRQCIVQKDRFLRLTMCNESDPYQKWTFEDGNLGYDGLERVNSNLFGPGQQPPELDYIENL